MDAETARIEAAKVVAVPGTSEHQLGLALDIIDSGYTTDITGIIYEPWHYRYVGRTAAKQIHELGVTLEEYIDMFYK